MAKHELCFVTVGERSQMGQGEIPKHRFCLQASCFGNSGHLTLLNSSATAGTLWETHSIPRSGATPKVLFWEKRGAGYPYEISPRV